MPLRHRSDFKQALSTLQQEVGEEPRVPTYSYKHKQWEAQSSSSTWWIWQGSWSSSDNSESQERSEPSIEYLHVFNLNLLQIDRLQLTAVYCKRRECKYNTSNDVFPRCTSDSLGKTFMETSAIDW